MKKFTKSILNMGAGRRLFTYLNGDERPSTITMSNIELCARRGSRRSGPWEATRTKLTGGITITATGPMPAFGGPGPQVQRRLGPGWTEKQFVLAAARTFQDALEMAHLNMYRDQVYRAFGGDAPLPEDVDAKVCEVEKTTGHSATYAEMSHEDCVFWITWLATIKPWNRRIGSK